MKKVLSLLVAFVFMQTQTWALSGGPVYTAVSTDLTGAFTGAFVAKSIRPGPGTAIPAFTPTGMGVFSLAVPVAGAATGTTVFFQGNVTYTGTIIGAANSGSRSITGIIQATSTSLYVVSATVPAIPGIPGIPAVIAPGPVPPAGTVLVPAIPPIDGFPAVPAETTALFAQGSLQAKVSGGGNNSAGGVDDSGNPVALGGSGNRLSGTATITAQFLNSAVVGAPAVANTTTYSVSGIRQTNAVATAVAP